MEQVSDQEAACNGLKDKELPSRPDSSGVQNNLPTDDDSSNDSAFEFDTTNEPITMRVNLIKYQDEFDTWRLPLERLTLSEQKMQAPDWINEILSRSNLNIQKKVFSNLEKLLDELHVDWNSEIHIFSLMHMILPYPYESIDYVRESYTLLLFMLLLRSKYQKEPSLRFRIKRAACLATRAYLKILDERKKKQTVFNMFSNKSVKFFGTIFLLMFANAVLFETVKKYWN